MLGAAAPSAAIAHLQLVSSAPADSSTVTSPAAIRLEFSQRVPIQLTRITLTDASGVEIPLGALVPADTGSTAFTARLPGIVPPGEYHVRWRTVGQDGHVIVGSFVFLVSGRGGAAVAPPHAGHDMHAPTPVEEATAATNPSQSWTAVAARWLNFLTLVGMIGAVCARMLVLPRARLGAEAARQVRANVWRYARLAAGLSILALFARLFSQSAAIHGIGEAFSLERISIMLAITPWGHAWGIQAIATALFLIGLVVALRHHVGWAVVLAAAVVLAFVPALSGHAAAVDEDVVFTVIVDAIHVFGASLWLGALGVLVLAALSARARLGTDDVRALVTAFSPAALLGAGIVVLSGVLRSLDHLTGWGQLISSDYGRMLLIKVGIIAVILMLGFYNWRVATPGATVASGAAPLRRAATLEAVLATFVLLATAILVALPPP